MIGYYIMYYEWFAMMKKMTVLNIRMSEMKKEQIKEKADKIMLVSEAAHENEPRLAVL